MTGIVEQVASKNVVTKFGEKPTYSVKVNGSWVKSGFKNPKVNVGDEIEFDGESGSYGMEGKDFRIISKGSGAAAASSIPVAAKPSYGKDRVFPIPPLHGDRSIVRQNALARATELVIASRGTKGTEVNDDVVSLIILIARKFEAYTAGDLDMEIATKEVKEGAA